MFPAPILSNLTIRLGLPASFTGITIAILIAVFEVQGWKIPTPLAVALIATLLVMIIAAVGFIAYEIVKEVQRFIEHRATSAAWVSNEDPGLLDYEADGIRASKRFTKEMAGLGDDTKKLGERLATVNKRIHDPELRYNPQLKQRRGNEAAKSIDRSAVYLEKRKALLAALVKDIARNFSGLIATATLDQPDDVQSADEFKLALESVRSITVDTIEKVAGYRDSVRSLQEQNLGRTLRISSKRLADGLDDTVKLLRNFKDKSAQLQQQLDRKLAARQSVQPSGSARGVVHPRGP